MGQMERALNRQYGIEQDRPTLKKYGRALLLALTAGVLATAAFAMFALGHGIGDGLNDDTVTEIWKFVRWPIALVLMMAAIALLFRWSPNRHQPAWSWLAFGSTVSVLLWSLATLGSGAVLPGQHDVQHHVRAARRDDRAAAVGAAVVDRDPVRGRDRGAAGGGARRRSRAEDESKVAVGLRAGLTGAGRYRLTMPLNDWFLPRRSAATPPPSSIGVAPTASRGPRATRARSSSTAPSTSLGCTRCSASASAGDWVSFTDWQGDPDELLDGPGTEVGEVLAELAIAGVNVRGLAVAIAPGGDELRRGEEPRVLACDQPGRRSGPPRPPGAPGRESPPEAGRHAARGSRPRRRVRRRHRPLPRAP